MKSDSYHRHNNFVMMTNYLINKTRIKSELVLSSFLIFFENSEAQIRSQRDKYCKVASSRLSRLVAHSRIFRLFNEGEF